MKGTGGLAGLVLVLGIGYYLYSEQAGGNPDKKRLSIQQVDIAGVRSDLLSLAQAERYYMAGHGTYATVEQLQESPLVSNLPVGPRRGYSYDVQIEDGRHFLITARPARDHADLPVLSIDETMTIITQLGPPGSSSANPGDIGRNPCWRGSKQRNSLHSLSPVFHRISIHL